MGRGAAILTGVVLAVGLFGAGTATGWKVRDADSARDLVREQKVAIQTVEKQAAATDQVAGAHHAQAERVRTVFRTITREVPAHVPPATAARFPLPVGFVRLHDAGALQVGVSAVPDAAGRPDDAASELGPDDAIGAILANYETAHQCRTAVLAWQDWAGRQMQIDRERRAR